jgi:hypothetical protein
MALERPPKYAHLNPTGIKTYRPPSDKVMTWQVVSPGYHDSLRTLSKRHGVPVEKIIEFNFPGSVENGHLVPEVVNWYLHYHAAFGCPETHDKKNRMFRGGERIAIPYLGSVQIGDAILLARGLVSIEGAGDVIASEKFTYEFKLPRTPKDLGYFLVQARVSVEGEIVRSGSGYMKIAFKKDQVKLAIEKKLEEDLKATLAVKVDQKTLESIAQAVAKGSKNDFARALAAPFEASLKQSYKFGRIAVVPELGAEFSTTPVIVRCGGEYRDHLLGVEGLKIDGKFVVKIGFNVGLSKKGWAWVLERVGPEALKRFIASAGESLAGLWEYLVAEGIIAAGAIVVATVAWTLALTYLMAWVVADAKRKGELTGLATWYVSAFSAKVFHEPRPDGFIIGDVKLRDQLILIGEKDAIAQARGVLRQARSPAANGSDEQALDAYRSILIDLEGGKLANAKWRLQRSLEQKSKQLAGL